MLRVEQQLQPSHAVDEWTSTASSCGEVQQVWCRGITRNHALRSPLVKLSASIAVRSAFWRATLGPGCNFVDGSSTAWVSMSICALACCVGSIQAAAVCIHCMYMSCICSLFAASCCICFVLACGGSAVLGHCPLISLQLCVVSGCFMLGIIRCP